MSREEPLAVAQITAKLDYNSSVPDKVGNASFRSEFQENCLREKMGNRDVSIMLESNSEVLQFQHTSASTILYAAPLYYP